MQYSIEEKDLKLLPNEIVNEIYSYLPVRPNKYDNCIDQINYISWNFPKMWGKRVYADETRKFYKYILYKNKSKRICNL